MEKSVAITLSYVSLPVKKHSLLSALFRLDNPVDVFV
jgi:hypothetical protein